MSKNDKVDNTEKKYKVEFPFDTKLSREYEKSLNVMRSNRGDDVLAVTILPNAESTDPFRFPKGNVIVVDDDAPVGREFVNRRLPSVCAVCSVKYPTKLQRTDEYYRDRLEALNSVVTQYADVPSRLTTLQKEGRSKEREGIDDSNTTSPPPSSSSASLLNVWNPELGKNGIAGVYKVTKDGRGQWDYKLFVYCDAGKATEDFYKEFKKNGLGGIKTMRELANSSVMRELEDLTAKNARRLLFKVSKAMDVNVNHETDPDFVSDEFCGPELAIPDLLQMNNTFEHFPESRAVVSYNMATVPFSSKQVRNENENGSRNAIALLNPEDGFVILPLVKSDMPKDLYGGFPFNLGKRNKTATTTNIGNARNGREGGFVVSDFSKATYVYETPSSGVNSAVVPKNPRLNSEYYSDVHERFYKNCKKMGWDKSLGRREFVPVACKISFPVRRSRMTTKNGSSQQK